MTDHELLELAAKLVEALEKNHQWHQAYDEYDGYADSLLEKTNSTTLAKARAYLETGGWTRVRLVKEHENEALRKDAERYRWLRSRDLDTIDKGGVFAGMTPRNIVLNEEHLDTAIDAALKEQSKC